MNEVFRKTLGPTERSLVNEPELVAQIRFVEWTAENRLRHAAFLGVRLDKMAKDVRRER